MKIVFVLAVTALAFSTACHDSAPRPEPGTVDQIPSQQEPATATNGDPNDPAPSTPPPGVDSDAHPDLVLVSPAAGDRTAGNPVTVTGRARTFENNVVIEVRDENGGLITTTWTTATGELGTLNPFSQPVWLTRDPGDRITIALLDHSAKDGSLRARTSRTVEFTGETVTETLMFPLQNAGNDCSAVRAVKREIPAAQGRLRALLEALIKGPTAEEASQYGVASPFPRGSAIRGVDIDGAKAILDFGPELSNVGGSCRALALRASIERTVNGVPGIDVVEIRAMGDAATALQP